MQFQSMPKHNLITRCARSYGRLLCTLFVSSSQKYQGRELKPRPNDQGSIRRTTNNRKQYTIRLKSSITAEQRSVQTCCRLNLAFLTLFYATVRGSIEKGAYNQEKRVLTRTLSPQRSAVRFTWLIISSIIAELKSRMR